MPRPTRVLQVLVAHNGPRGLGGRRHSICGVDWTEPEADFGDPDLQAWWTTLGWGGLAGLGWGGSQWMAAAGGHRVPAHIAALAVWVWVAPSTSSPPVQVLD